MTKIFEVAGVGFGPANIALAALLDEEHAFSNYVFLEGAKNPVWQGEMLFENALDIHSNVQNIPHRDLATLRSPRSKYTFLNYLHSNDKLLSHLNMDLMMPMRPDFAAYISWVSEQLSGCVVNEARVNSITMLDEAHDHVYRIDLDGREPILARHVVVGTGREPFIPPEFSKHIGNGRVFHLSQYNSSHKSLIKQGARKFAVIGSSQSAAEILLHLSKYEPRLELHSFIRRFAFPLKDTNPFMSEIYFPSFTDMYFDADKKLKSRIDQDVYRTNYGSCDLDVLEELYRQIYYDKMHDNNHIFINRLTEIRSVEKLSFGVRLNYYDRLSGESKSEDFDGVILATGFRNIGTDERSVRIPGLIQGLKEQFELDDDGCVQVDRAYRVSLKEKYSRAGAVVLNGLCETSHGMGDAGSISLLAPRVQTIANALVEMDKSSMRQECFDKVAV